MTALGLSTTRWRRSLLQRIAEAFPPLAQWPAFVACLLLMLVGCGWMVTHQVEFTNAVGAAADAVFRTIQGVLA